MFSCHFRILCLHDPFRADFPASFMHDSDSDFEEEEDEADEDSNGLYASYISFGTPLKQFFLAEDNYKNEYPDEESSEGSSGMIFHDVYLKS